MRLSQTVQLYDDATYTPARSHVITQSAVLAGLGADRLTLAATGADVATLHYAGPSASPHAWTVNGQAVPVPATAVASGEPAAGLNESTIEVTAAAAGPVEVTVGGETLTLAAV